MCCSRRPHSSHSFPTRRSSDLTGTLAARASAQESQRDGLTAALAEEAVRVADGLLGQDRKSKRLNSSHTVTSYAVFCLKKKTSSHKSARSWDQVQAA